MFFLLLLFRSPFAVVLRTGGVGVIDFFAHLTIMICFVQRNAKKLLELKHILCISGCRVDALGVRDP